ncbi:MAG: aminoglycoside phosphotransferase family protein [Arthrobacter sp.]
MAPAWNARKGKTGPAGSGTAGRERALLESPALAAPLAELLTPRRMVLESWTHQRTFDRPGAGVTALWQMTALDPAGERITLYAGATTSQAAARGGVLRTAVAGTPLFLWLHPHDPLLPDLPWALSPPRIAQAVFRDADGRDAVLRMNGYRPLRRAVVHASSRGRQAYIKVVLPSHADGLQQRHQLLAGTAVPAPALLPGAEGRSAVVLSPLPGIPLLRELTSGTSRITAADLTGLLDALPEAALDLRRRPAWAERARAYGHAAAGVLPEQRTEIDVLSTEIAALVADLDPGPVVPVHGDFYEGNLLTSAGRITGLLDVDGLGPGHRVDDLACFLGHLTVLARLSPGTALPGRLADMRPSLEAAATDAGSSASALNARAAGVALSLVAGARGGRLDRRANAGRRLAAAHSLLHRARDGRDA